MSQSIHLAAIKDVPSIRVRKLVERKLSEAGFEIVNDDARAGARRLVLRKDGKWCALVATDDASISRPDWAPVLSADLRVPALALFVWDGEASLVARRFEDGDEVASLELPRQASRDKSARARARVDVFLPWISAAKRQTMKGWLILDRRQKNDGHVREDPFVELERAAAGVARVIGLPSRWLRPGHVDVGVGDEIIAYRPAGVRTGLPILPPVPPLEEGYDHRIDANVRAYRGRRFAVGFIACDERCDLNPVLASFSNLLRRFCPETGLNVRVRRGKVTETLLGRFTSQSQLSEAQLAKGGLVALSRNEAFAPLDPLFWSIGDREGARLIIGWCIPRTDEPARDKAITEVMCSVVENAVVREGCISALLTAQASSWSYGDASLPYERLAQTHAGATDPAWLRTHVRSPGWRVLVPRDAVARLPKRLPSGIGARRVTSGLLLGVDTDTPYAMGDIEGLERYLLPVVGSLADFPDSYAPWLS